MPLVKEESRTAFFGEDIYIDVPSGNVGEVLFKSRINKTYTVVLLQEGKVMNPRGSLDSQGRLVLEDVQEEDEGVYIIKNTNTNATNAEKHLILIVRGTQSSLFSSRNRKIGRVFRKCFLAQSLTSVIVLLVNKILEVGQRGTNKLHKLILSMEKYRKFRRHNCGMTNTPVLS